MPSVKLTFSGVRSMRTDVDISDEVAGAARLAHWEAPQTMRTKALLRRQGAAGPPKAFCTA